MKIKSFFILMICIIFFGVNNSFADYGDDKFISPFTTQRIIATDYEYFSYGIMSFNHVIEHDVDEFYDLSEEGQHMGLYIQYEYNGVFFPLFLRFNASISWGDTDYSALTDGFGPDQELTTMYNSFITPELNIGYTLKFLDRQLHVTGYSGFGYMYWRHIFPDFGEYDMPSIYHWGYLPIGGKVSYQPLKLLRVNLDASVRMILFHDYTLYVSEGFDEGDDFESSTPPGLAWKLEPSLDFILSKSFMLQAGLIIMHYSFDQSEDRIPVLTEEGVVLNHLNAFTMNQVGVKLGMSFQL